MIDPQHTGFATGCSRRLGLDAFITLWGSVMGTMITCGSYISRTHTIGK